MTLAERKRQLVRDELTGAALQLFVSQGFERTTVDQIVAAAGVSRRTFFRYFQSKEDVVVEFLDDLGAQLREALAARPDEEPVAVALRRALGGLAGQVPLRWAVLTLTTPALHARYLEWQARWRAELAGAGAELGPALATALVFAAFDTALGVWVTRGGEVPLGELVMEALELLGTSR